MEVLAPLLQLHHLFQGHDDLLDEIALHLDARLLPDLTDLAAPAGGKEDTAAQEELDEMHVDFELRRCATVTEAALA
jgi:hypothetical protein